MNRTTATRTDATSLATGRMCFPNPSMPLGRLSIGKDRVAAAGLACPFRLWPSVTALLRASSARFRGSRLDTVLGWQAGSTCSLPRILVRTIWLGLRPSPRAPLAPQTSQGSISIANTMGKLNSIFCRGLREGNPGAVTEPSAIGDASYRSAKGVLEQ